MRRIAFSCKTAWPTYRIFCKITRYFDNYALFCKIMRYYNIEYAII
jgi:uncharacterized protein YjaG (DUF416 family)